MLITINICRLCGEQKETLQHLLSGCKKLALSEYVRRRDNALKIMAVKWEKKEGLLSEKTRCYNAKWEKRHAIEKDGKKMLWDSEHKMSQSSLQGQETGSNSRR